MGLRDDLTVALKDAMKAKDARRLSTVRLAQAAVKDRDIANRTAGKEPSSDAEITELLAKMVKQREESAGIYEGAGRAELAQQERDEIAVLRQFMPEQMSADEIEKACRAVVEETGAASLRDMGRCMGLLKERYAGRMDFARASAVLKTLLQ